MEALINRISALAAAAKVGILALLLAVIGGGYYSWFYSDLLDEISRKEWTCGSPRRCSATTRSASASTWPTSTSATSCARSRRSCCGCCPRTTTSPVHRRDQHPGGGVGLQKVSSIREASTTEVIYERIPVRMSLMGSFHQINRFFKNVSEMQRIVTVADLSAQLHRRARPDGKRPAQGRFRGADLQAGRCQAGQGGGTGRAGSGRAARDAGRTRSRARAARRWQMRCPIDGGSAGRVRTGLRLR